MSSDGRLFVIIVGCGRMGSYLANKLSADGHSVVAIDVNESAFAGLSAEYSGFRVQGDAAEFAVLKQNKTDKADLVIAATSDDNVNLMVAQIAKRIFHVPRVIARIIYPRRGEFYRSQGIETICPTSIAAEVFLESLKKPPIAAEGETTQ
ncbi:MAG: TrkA family potassium uptake protein [Planctomycetota bacterium]